jgi:PAS domain S-box-containing protein
VAQSEPIRILYIEDDPGLARLVQKRLGRMGYAVDIAADGEEGIAKYEAGSYGLVCVDQSLPVYDGLEVIRILGARGPLPPMIMITGTGDERVAVEAMKLGAGDYIVKDVEGGYLELLPSVIEKVFQQRRAAAEKQSAEDALRESEEKFRNLAEQSPNMIFINKQGKIVYANEKCTEVMGYTREEFYSPDFDFFTLVEPEFRKGVKESFGRHMRGEDVAPYEYALITKEGERIDAILATKLIRYGGENAILGTVTDITERKRVEDALRESEERFRQFFENEPEYCYLISAGGLFLDVNAAALKILGFKKKELIGKPFEAICSPESLPKMQELFAQWGNIVSFKDQEMCILTKDGTKRTVLLSASTVQDHDGKRAYSVAVQRDITEHAWVKETLQKTEEHLRIIFEGASDGFLYVDREGIILFTNARMKEILADPDPEGKPLSAFHDEENQKILAQNLKARWEGKGTIYEIVLTDAAGRRHNLLVSGTPSRDKQGVIQGSFGIYRDVTQERDAAKALLEHKEALTKSFFGTAEALSKVIEDRDPYTSGHSVGVGGLAEIIARAMGFPEDQITGIYIAGVLHDIGKMAVPVEILVKPGRLNTMEQSLIQMHPEAGYEILKGIDFPWPVAQATLQHHERMDGSGYPRGLKGEEIIPEARILAVADVVDAMTHHRPYRPAFSLQDTLKVIEKGRERLYDSQVVDACVEVLKGAHPFAISEYSTTSTTPQFRKRSTNSSVLPTTTHVRASGRR